MRISIKKLNDRPRSRLIHSESPVIYPMFERRLISGGCNEKPVKNMIAEVTPVEFVAELVQVLLEEFPSHAVIDVGEACIGVGYGDMYPRKHLPYVSLVYHAPHIFLEHGGEICV